MYTIQILNPSNSRGLERRPVFMHLPFLHKNGFRQPMLSDSFANLDVMAEQAKLGWSVRRELSKINYHIHTDAIKQNLIPAALTKQQMSVVYANEADVLNMTLFGFTAKDWRDAHPDLQGIAISQMTVLESVRENRLLK